MRLKYAIACLVCVAVTLVWYSALRYRLPYLDQIPVYDADVMTSFARMCVRSEERRVGKECV